jgi:uncharacterized protein
MATAHAPGFPLPLRNALAALAIDALDDDEAVAALGWLVDAATLLDAATAARLTRVHLADDGRLLDVHVPHRDAVHRHAVRALRAVAAYRRAPTAEADASPGGAVARAVPLWNEALFFEVHEVLETAWKRTSGDVRQALQGLIQIGVALHHHAHGNLRGARTLIREGRERLAVHRAALPSLDVDALLAATEPWDAAPGAAPASDAAPPRLARRA